MARHQPHGQQCNSDLLELPQTDTPKLGAYPLKVSENSRAPQRSIAGGL